MNFPMEEIQGHLGIVDKLDLGPASFLVEHKIIYSVMIFLAFLMLTKFLRFILSHVLPIFTSKTKTNLDDLIISRIKKPCIYLVILLGVYIALIPLDIPGNILSFIDEVILSLAIILFAVVFAKVADAFIDVWGSEWAEKTRSTIDNSLLPIMHKTSKVLFFVFCIILMLKVWGVNVSSLLAGVGIAGIVLGLALKDSLANIFGGMSIVMDRSIKVGDKIKLGTGEIGIVKDIGLRSTKLKTLDNDTLTIPNGVLAQSVITNYIPSDNKKREIINFSVGYGADIEKVEKVVLKALEKIEGAVYDPKPIVVFREMGESGLNFSAIIWSTWQGSSALKEVRGVKIEATKRIYEALNKAKINIPYPTRTVYMHRAKNSR